MAYIAPYLIDEIYVSLPEGQFIVPVCTTRERFKLITNALWNAGSEVGNGSYDHLVDWLDALSRIRAGCEFDPTDNCNVLFPDNERLTWFPESPYAPLPDVPDGYNFHPFTIVDSSIISDIISVFGFGYKIGDVYTDLTKIPIGSSWTDLLTTQYLNFPRFRINDLQGRGTVKIHFLNIPQGGRALVTVDGVIYLNPYANRLVELSVDKLSFPPETEVEQTIEVEVEGSGTHFIDVVWLPVVDNDFIPLFFGGGIRYIELCGFDMPIADPCCPDEFNILYKIFQQNNLYQEFVLNMLDDGTPESFAPDAPENYDSNTGDADTNARIRALCAAVTKYVNNVISGVLQAQRDADAVADVIEIFPPFGIILGLVDIVVDIAVEALVALAGDRDAINDVICHMVANLSGQAVTQAIFKDSVVPSAFTPLSNQWQVAVMIDIANASVSNWRAFTSILGELYESISGGAQVDCPCDCEDDIILIDYFGSGNTITPIGDCHFYFHQLEPIDGKYYFSFRDTLGRCLLIEASTNPTYPTQGAIGTETFATDCSGTESEFVGGFTGGEARSVHWWQAGGENWFKITLGTP